MAVTLLPNFGAEEGDEGAVANRPALREAALLWRELFPAGARLLGLRDLPAPLGPWTSGAWDFIPDEGGVAWLATERAHRRLQRAGVRPAGPDPAVVARVHDKAFALRVAAREGLVPPDLPLFVFGPGDRPALEAALARLPPGSHWVLKPRSGSSGRGRIPIRGGVAPRLGGGWERLAAGGGAILEPWLDRVLDLSVQLHLDRSGQIEILGSTRLVLAPSGLYLGNECVVDEAGRFRAGTRWDEAVESAALRVGAAAAATGYFGPCGLDAFVYRDAAGREVLRPVVEFNARFTMGIVALGILRRLRSRGALPDGGRYRFVTAPLAAPPGAEAIPLHGEARAIVVRGEANAEPAPEQPGTD